MKRILICRLMVFLTVALVSCSDDTSESIPQNPDKDMYLRVNVPRTYASGADETDSKETVIICSGNSLPERIVFEIGIRRNTGYR